MAKSLFEIPGVQTRKVLDWVLEINNLDVRDFNHFEEFKKLFLEFPILVLKKQTLDQTCFLEFMRKFGTPVAQKFKRNFVIEMTDRSQTQLSSTSELGWHSDESYQTEYAEALCLYAVCIPPEPGKTHWANANLAYLNLSEDQKARLANLICYHEFENFDDYLKDLVEFESEKAKRINYAFGKCAHSVVGTWREKPFLRLNHGFTTEILDAPAELLPNLLDKITEAGNIYSHQWSEGDLVVCNNHLLIHRRDRFLDPRRFLYRGLMNL